MCQRLVFSHFVFTKVMSMKVSDVTIESVMQLELPKSFSACDVAGYPNVFAVSMANLKELYQDADESQMVVGGFGAEKVPGVQVPGVKLPGMTKFMALEQYNPFWIRPRVGQDCDALSQIDKQTLCLLWQDDASCYHVILPLIGKGFRACLLGDQDQGLAVQIELDREVIDSPVLMVASGDDPYAVMHQAVATAADTLRTFRLRTDKPVPDFVQWLGWCTWDAFYHEVSQAKLYEGLESFAQAGLVPKVMVLDDGWLSLDDKSRLNSFEPNPEKFPDGLGKMVANIKAQYGVKFFGIWHTLGGYWQGINPESALGQEFEATASARPLRNSEGGPMAHGFAASPKQVARFFHDFYSYLRRNGVDMTKVDNQNAMAYHATHVGDHALTVRASQLAYQGAAWTHMMGNTIHCMCNRNDVAYNMSATTVWRNSDDYFPKRDGSHQCHVFYNVMNNMWSSQFAVPDWDMFWSGAETGAFHAAARAISGGPVYASDAPGKQDFDILRKLCTSDGKTLRCDQPALPTRDSLFVDYFTEARLLKIFNRNGNVGVLGVFHCLWAEKPEERQAITDQFAVSNVPGLVGERFAIYQHESQTLIISDRDTAHDITLDFRKHEIMTIAPLEEGVAMLGLIDKYNSAAAIVDAVRLSDTQWQWTLADGGMVGLVSDKPIVSAKANGKPVMFSKVGDSCMWTIEIPTGEPVCLQVSI